MNLEEIFFISANRLKAAEPLMEKYFDYESNMFLDEIKLVVETIDHITIENGIPTVDYLKTFYNTNLAIPISDKLYPREDVADVFPDYFADVDDKDAQFENDKVYLSLSYMGYAYFKQVNGYYNTSFIVEALGLEYQSALHNEIYPEMLSLYRMILESKRYKNKGGKITLTNNFHQIDINSHAWFLDDMEKYFKDRFPDLTLEKINELLPQPQKAGRKAKDPYVMILIWGTYHLMKNHHSAFRACLNFIELS